MNKVVLKFGELELTAKFGIGFIGRYLELKGQTIQEVFSKFESNIFLIAPDMMYHAIKEGTKDFELTESEFEDLIDENGGIGSVQLQDFIKAFTHSITVNFPNETGNVGKSSPKLKKA